MAEPRHVPRGTARSTLALALRRCLEEALEADRRDAAERLSRRATLRVVSGKRSRAA